EKITPYKDSKLGKKQQVSRMFDTISGNYDGLNRVISLGMDQSWRRKVIAMIVERKPENALDIATGTGDLAISLAQKGVRNIVGVDISEGMLKIGRRKVKDKKLEDRITLKFGDSEDLPFK